MNDETKSPTVEQLTQALREAIHTEVCTSGNLGSLFHAMSKAQGVMTAAHKTQKNAFFDSTYADYADIWRVVQKPLADNEITLMHFPQRRDGMAGVITYVGHSSGEWMQSGIMLPVPTSKDGTRTSVAYGAVISYCKRYQTQAICNIAADEDDDLQGVERPVIAPELAQKMYERVDKLGGKKMVTAFCKKFGIEKMEQLTLENLDAAEAAISEKEQSA